MKKNISLLVAGSLLFLAGIVIQAGTNMRNACSANIPFDFYVKNAKLPAGQYTIRESNSGNAQLLIQNNDGGNSAYVNSVGATPKNEEFGGKLVFHRYNNDYFLSEIWAAENVMGHVITPSKKELELGNDVSQVSKAGSTNFKIVAIALK